MDKNNEFYLLEKRIFGFNSRHFNTDQKKELLIGVNSNLTSYQLMLISNSNFSAKKMQLLITILRMNISEKLKDIILKCNLSVNDLHSIKLLIEEKVNDNEIISFIENGKSIKDILDLNRKHEKVKKHEKRKFKNK